jgi:hypothetical protein
MYHDDTGFCSQDACKIQKLTWTTFDASKLRCAHQNEVGGAWNIESTQVALFNFGLKI